MSRRIRGAPVITRSRRYVERTTAELAARGHQVLIVAPSRSTDAVRETRHALAAARDDPTTLLPAPGAPPRVLAVGDALPDLPGSRRTPALPVDVSRTIENLLTILPLDVCHVHEPFAPSTSSAALRHSRALNVGTFHLPTEPLLSTQVARKVVKLVLGRLDARTASFGATRELMQRFFPADYRVVLPGADAPAARVAGAGGRVRFGFVDDEERPALRLFLRALRRIEPSTDWEATIVSARGPSSSAPLRADLESRVRYASPGRARRGRAARRAATCSSPPPTAPGPPRECCCAPSTRARCRSHRGCRSMRRCSARASSACCSSRATSTRSPRSSSGSSADAALRERPAGGRRADARAAHLGARHRRARGGLRAARRPPPRGRRQREDRRAAARSRPLIDVDLHMHTDHSHDCATPVEVLLATAREQGLGAIAVTDHNVVSGALEAREKAAEFGVKVIVAEEVKTADQGEVIGLFIEEKIPRGMSLAETVAEIKRQGGLVYVPHPFDRMHAVPDYEHLLTIIEEIDAIEVYNPRVAIGSFNEEAQRFAAKYRILAGAGSDSHVAQGLGSVRVRMADFDGPEEFLEALRGAEITTKPSSLLYVQALKFLETKATPQSARRAVRERRVRRATRKS